MINSCFKTSNLIKYILMNKILTFLIVMISSVILAQTEIKGKVVDEFDMPITGANIIIKKNAKGTSTNFDGVFTLKAAINDELVVSFMGFKTRFIKVKSTKFLKIILKEDANQLAEVIITSLGIKKEKKALGYSATELKAADINIVKTNNIVNSLSGKVAGLQVTGASTGVASSSRVVIRGESSLNINSNEPLFILDGTPVNNNIFGVGGNATNQRDMPTDYGNGLSELNADDFESVTVLKGAAASALYGSRAANGVIVITTKKGKKNNGIGVEINSSTMASTALRLPELQTKFGGGWAGKYASDYGTNFGPDLNGKVIDQEVSLGEYVKKPFKNRYNLKDFFKTGFSFQNSIALSKATDTGSFYLSYGNVHNTGIVPNTNLKGNNYRLNMSRTITDKWTVNVNANYINRKSDNLTVSGYGSQGIMYNLLWNYINTDLKEHKNYWIEKDVKQRRLFSWGDNPWFIVNENINAFNKTRLLGNISSNYQLTDKLSLLTRIGLDESNDFRWSRRSIGSHRNPNGMYREQKIKFSELNADALLSYSNNFADFTTKTSVGTNTFKQKITEGFMQGDGLAIPGMYTAQNINVSAVKRSSLYQKEINSVYAFTNIGFKKYLYLDFSVRNDWSSTLPSSNNSYFYPAASMSFLASKVFQMPNFIDFLKVRANIAKVGKDTDPYRLKTAYNYGTLNGTLTNSSQLLNANLKPETTVSTEFGIESYFLNKRISLDATYYSATSKNQILNMNVSGANGYNSIVQNAGEIKNNGFEIALGLKPIKTADFEWDITANFTKNKSEVVNLLDNLDTFIIAEGPDNITVEARPGGQMGDIYGESFIRNKAGEIIFEKGLPLTGNRKKVGNYNPDWMLGLGSSISYKGFNLSAQFDIRQGGEIYSYTNAVGRESGILALTESWRDGVVGDGVMSDGNNGYVKNTVKVPAEAWAYAIPRNNAEANIFDASYVKLRQLSFGYSLNNKTASLLGLQSMSLSVVGSNLFLWTDVPNIDPEAQALNGGSLLPGFEVTQLPSSKSYGFKLNMKF